MSVEFADDELDELSARVVADPDPARTSMPAVAPTSSATSALLLGIFTTCPPVSKLTSAEYPGEVADPQAARRPRSRAAREVAPFVLRDADAQREDEGADREVVGLAVQQRRSVRHDVLLPFKKSRVTR